MARSQRTALGWHAAQLCAVVITIFVCTASARGQCNYEVTAIIQGPPCPFVPSSHAVLRGRGMNTHGHVVGYWTHCFDLIDEAYYWTPETGLVTLLRPPGVNRATANDINDHGQIVGGHLMDGNGWKAFVYDIAAGTYTYLEPVHPDVTATFVSTLNAINNAGIAVGSRTISKPGEPTITNAVIWNTNTGEVTDLGVGEGPSSGAVDVNEVGDVAGWSGTSDINVNGRAVVWLDRQLIPLGVLPGMIRSRSKHLNSHREVVGLSNPESGTGLHFLWAEGTITPLLPPLGYDLIGTAAYSDTRQLTGHMRVEGTSTFHPFLAQHGQYHNMRDLIVKAPDGIVIDLTHIISATGTILARSGARAVLLSPVGVPTADLNHDCRVDYHDLLMLLDAWHVPQRAGGRITNPADLNGDGVVNVGDLLILLTNWTH